jgi:small-conductance mechanosensitive channel
MDDAIPTPLINQLNAYLTGFWKLLPQLFIALLVILLVWGAARGARWIVGRALTRARMRRSLIEVFQMISTTLIWTFGTLIAMTIVFPSLTPAKALTALGLGSVAIGFAFKDIFENFIAGILILIREPFKLDDFIECDDFEGKVEEITVRDTHIRQTDGQLVVMPNAVLFKTPVTVRTSQNHRRTSIIVGVAYGEDVDAARKIISDAVTSVDLVRDDVRDVQVFATAFSASSIDFEVAWWTGSRPLDIRASRDQVVASIKRALDDEGIEIPFPYRTLTFKGPGPEMMPQPADNAEPRTA